jgi:biopolymer transport protein TolQ
VEQVSVEQSMSVISLIANASFVVQLVMFILVLASVSSWVIIVQRWRLLAATRAQLNDFEERFWSGIDFNQLYKECQKNPDPRGAENVFTSGLKEFGKIRQQAPDEPDTIMEGTHRAMRIAISRETEILENNLSFLATVGSTSPYIGLFGTVWGIMHSFQGLAVMKQATIASVAPGISEALIATAMGLLAAIPAVIFYNRFVTRTDQLVTSMQTFGEEFSSILYRQTHRMKQQQKKGSE